MLDASEGRTIAAAEAFRRVLALDGRSFDRVIRTCVFQLARPELAVAIARDDAGRLLAVADILREDHSSLAAEAKREAIALLHAQCAASGTPPRILVRAAEYSVQDGQLELAAAYYRRALSRECSNVAWRMGYARTLAAIGRAAEARRQAGICLKLRPDLTEAKRLIADLRRRSLGSDNAV